LKPSEHVHTVLKNVSGVLVPGVGDLAHRFQLGPQVGGGVVLIDVFVLFVSVLSATIDVHLISIHH
jgi:hypothetical protein